METDNTLEKRFQDHVELSDKTHAEIRLMLQNQPTKKDFEALVVKMAGLATKKDVEGVTGLYDFLVKTAHAISSGSGWTYRASLTLLTIAAAVALITGGLKAAVIWLVTWAMPK